ncbi:carbohydrate ABC transporter permease [Actinokineospora globicatena]|uniref:carbohydrate ABC transporter permease n=1 Tax=Actinokineospora globicatena TaxID=103729 RepID=UPI0020A57E06|nr:carbohydrate ABC transporter permease [Actinokineospora globicatena]MCP2303493.1 cellobiose ABC transporter membrane protein [Actinokineospora globicatena]GLW79373.1 sugar ABC transporter permease [Actinokineospora globicatena]GLW86217.1 sugar ABC transporter permease [Actinokineospora globicatena]
MTGRFGQVLALAALVVFSLFPLYSTLVVASHDNADLAAAIPPLLPGGRLLDHVGEVIERVDLGQAMVNSAVIAGTVAVANALACTVAGFAFARLRFRGREALFAVVIASAMVPTQLGIVPLFLVVDAMGWYDTLAAVIVPGLVSAFGVFWMRQACLEAVSTELVDASRVDGCSLARVYWHVALPALRGPAAVLAMLSFATSWNDFSWPLVALDPNDTPTTQVVLSGLAGGYYTDYPLVLTGVLVSIVPVLLLFVLFARKVVAVLAGGAAQTGR